MAELTVGIADYRVTTDRSDSLVTYALGSCVAVVAWDPKKRVGGMIHFMLPVSNSSPEKAKEQPAMFADTGVPLLFHALYEKGCGKQDLVVKVVGGAKVNDESNTFEIGERNRTVLRKIFWKAGILVRAEDVGGTKSRTVRLSVETGAVTVMSQGMETQL